MRKVHTAYNAHPIIKKAFVDVIDFPDDSISYSFKLLPAKYELTINYHDKESVIINRSADSRVINNILKDLFVNLPDNANLISFEICPDKAFTLNVEYLAEFK